MRLCRKATRSWGFLGGIDVPAVIRYGYGFIQGADKAAQELGVTDVNIKYWYSGSFEANDDIATKMDNWYVGGTGSGLCLRRRYLPGPACLRRMPTTAR